jgi:hypothetical protein
VKVSTVIHLNHFSDEEFERCWYKKADLQRIKEELLLTVKLMKIGDLPKDTLRYCRRGTEFRTREGACRRMFNKEVARDAVRDEQDGQWDEGIFDSDVLASVCIAATRQCQVEAQLMGSKDEKDARESDAAALPDISKPSNKLETGVCSPLRVNKNIVSGGCLVRMLPPKFCAWCPDSKDENTLNSLLHPSRRQFLYRRYI